MKLYLNVKTKPIKDLKVLEAIGVYLKSKNYRDYVLFKVQLNTALRISDVVKIKYENCYENGKVKKYLEIKEQKTQKNKKILINNELKVVLENYNALKSLKMGSYLFASNRGGIKPLSTTQVHRIYQNTGKLFNLENFNSHSLRKTFCYFVYKQTKDVALLMKLLNHSSEKITLRYIDVDDDDIDNLYKNFQF